MEAPQDPKQARRERILEAALGLLASGGAQALTMRELARAAGLSEMTPYNLFGNKGGVIEALLDSRVAEIVDRSAAELPDDLLERLFVSTVFLADAWTDGALPVRELMRCARESGADLSSFSEVPISRMRSGLEAAVDAGLIGNEIPPATLARQIHILNVGAFQLWAAGEVDAEELRRDLIVGLGVSLLALAKPAARGRILARIRAAQRTPRRRRPRVRANRRA